MLKIKLKPESFHFVKYICKKNKIYFYYKISFFNRGDLDFVEKITFSDENLFLDKKKYSTFIESLHLVLGISYYKLYIPSKILIPYNLSKEQANFWNSLYRNGLGEFCYRNNLKLNKIANFPYSKKLKEMALNSIDVNEKILLGIGGGKDSIVASELLKNFNVTSFSVETQKKDVLFESVSKIIGNPTLIVKREMDKKIFEKYEDSYNGHVPISAIFAFTGLLTSAIYKFKYLAVANEFSSNFGNINYDGKIINHQWSKSMEFELMFQEYTRKFITSDIKYFSPIRQFSEIRVTKIFTKYKKYFPFFSSCNRNVRIYKDRPESLWCGECPKCAFVFLMLAAFLNKKELICIFNKNLFADKSLKNLFNDLLGFGDLKPFDCVGTFEESRAALFLASKNFKEDFIIKKFLSKIKKPEKLVEKVMKTNFAPTLPTPFRFLGIENICILGYGKEGKVSEKFVKNNYPNLEIGILDESLDKKYLDKQTKYDLAIKTPGISKEKVIIPYVTATNIFFSQNKNFTIGVTGSKGKSTTTSLIYAILKEAGKKVHLVGNIGNPMLETDFKKVSSDEIFVIELSSYMLDDIEYSPNISILLNLFPEHMNYHGSIENYYQAKENIFKFQKNGDFFFRFPFKENIPLNINEILLQGEHNLKNIKAAIKVARYFNISDFVIKKVLKNFKPLAHRLEFIGKFKDIIFYDDAISTTPDSTIEAIKTLKKIDTIFLGGEDRGYDFSNLENILRKFNIRNIVLFPDSGKRILKSRRGFNVFETNSMKEAVEFAYKNTEKGKICVLSCGSPSYSLWKNFEEKGDLFSKYVNFYENKV